MKPYRTTECLYTGIPFFYFQELFSRIQNVFDLPDLPDPPILQGERNQFCCPVWQADTADILFSLTLLYCMTWRNRLDPLGAVSLSSCFIQHFSGSGYSTPKVSTVTVFILWGVTGRSAYPVGVSAMAFTTSIPSITFPKAAYWPSR